MNKNTRLIVIVVFLWALAAVAFGQANQWGPFDPGAVRKTDQAARVDTINASFTGDIDVTGDVGAATVNGVAPLTAEERVRALVGSSTQNFLAQNATFTRSTTEMAATIDTAVELVLADGASMSVQTLFGASTRNLGRLQVAASNLTGIDVMLHGGTNIVATLSPGLSAATADTAAKLCVYSAGSGAYLIKNNTGVTITCVVRYSGRK